MAGGKNEDNGNVIKLPLPEKAAKKKKPSLTARLFRKAKAEPEEVGKLFKIPPKTITAEEAVNALRKLFPDDVTTTTHLELRFPDKVKFYSFPYGVEFFDMHSERPQPIHPDETLKDLEWVKHWYFAVFRRGDMIIGRFIDRSLSHPWIPLEQPLYHPTARYGRYSLRSFIETMVYGDPPD